MRMPYSRTELIRDLESAISMAADSELTELHRRFYEDMEAKEEPGGLFSVEIEDFEDFEED